MPKLNYGDLHLQQAEREPLGRYLLRRTLIVAIAVSIGLALLNVAVDRALAPIHDPAQYPAIIQKLSQQPSAAFKHFPPQVPPDAQDVRIKFAAGAFAQAGPTLTLEYTTSPARAQTLEQEWSVTSRPSSTTKSSYLMSTAVPTGENFNVYLLHHDQSGEAGIAIDALTGRVIYWGVQTGN